MKTIDEIRKAFQRVHHKAIGTDDRAYMSIPADPERDADLIVSAAFDELEKLRGFKAYVHQRLDEANVASDPDPAANARHGCRIEGRLNLVLNFYTGRS